MLKRRSRAEWIPAMASVMLLAAGCTSSGGTASGHLEQTTVVVDAFAAIDTAGLFIAQQDGLFAAQGLTVKLNVETLVQPQIDDLLTGKADISSGDYVTYIENDTGGDPDRHNQNPDLRIIAESSFLQPNVLALVAPAQSRIGSITGLKGKSISVLAPRNISDLLVDSLLVGHGIPVADEHYPLVAFPDIGPAFQERKMDAAFAPEPFVTSLEETYGVQELADLDQGSTTDFPIQGMVTTASWAQRNPNTLAAFLRAYNEGQVIATTERAKVEQVLETFLHLPGSVAAVVALPAFPRGVDPVRLQRVVSAMLRFGILGPQFENYNVRSIIYQG
ncbi:MAG: ABC transporter substrate-binding protein [Streptosporangiaceae bacterium]